MLVVAFDLSTGPKNHVDYCHAYSGRGCHIHDRMVVGFTTTYAISAYHH